MYSVYIHKLYGHIVYIGSGSPYRYKARTKCRSKNHLELWDDLTFEIVAQNLTKEESLNLEEELINTHWDSGFLLNHSFETAKELAFQEAVKFKMSLGL